MATVKKTTREFEKKVVVKETVEEIQLTLNEKEASLICFLVGSLAGKAYQKEADAIYVAICGALPDAYTAISGKHTLERVDVSRNNITLADYNGI